MQRTRDCGNVKQTGDNTTFRSTAEGLMPHSSICVIVSSHVSSRFAQPPVPCIMTLRYVTTTQEKHILGVAL